LPPGPEFAVLPFDNLSRDPDQEFFSDGPTDGIFTAPSRSRDLFAIARNSTFRYRGKPIDVRLARQDLGASYVLEESVQEASTAFRATAQLLDAKDGMHLSAVTHDRALQAARRRVAADPTSQTAHQLLESV
jgi:adenylate cyclase